MIQNPYQKYQQNSIMTATGPELTLMLYNGAIKFCNQAIEAIDKGDLSQAHKNIVKAEDINGLFGPVATKIVTMPRNKEINNPFLNRLKSHPNLFPILQNLLQRLRI